MTPLERLASHYDPKLPDNATITIPEGNGDLRELKEMTERSSIGNADAELYDLRDLIASHIACEKDCQSFPNGCGCALTAARAVLDRPAQQTQWQPIETAPKDGTAIWLLIDGRPYIGYGEIDWLTEKLQWSANAGFRRKAERPSYRTASAPDEIFGCNGVDVKPTNWQPLPEPQDTTAFSSTDCFAALHQSPNTGDGK